MTQLTSNAPVVEIKPQPNVYTVLLLIAIVVLVVTLGIVLHTLMAAPGAGYGLSLGNILQGGPFPK